MGFINQIFKPKGFKKNSTKTFEKNLEDQYPQLAPIMLAHALRLTRNKDAAEDLVHDSFVRALTYKDKFEEDSYLKAWILKIQYNLFVQKYRRNKKYKEILSNPYFDQDYEANPEEINSEQETQALISELLENLSEDNKKVILLCDYEGYAYKEAAEILDTPIGTVMSRLFRGRKKLAQIIEKNPHKYQNFLTEFKKSSNQNESSLNENIIMFKKRNVK